MIIKDLYGWRIKFKANSLDELHRLFDMKFLQNDGNILKKVYKELEKLYNNSEKQGEK